MTISDIIKKQNDRVFIIDPECFIIFTGDSIDDNRPFIRIGNWINLPTKLIPQIENIIITDIIVGNPAFEQFNIDVNDLHLNRYIGNSHIVKKFLQFQKIFGLDLKNASIVDAEKDIPDISNVQSISDRDSFIGIFYSDGNFVIIHNDKELFNLKNVLENSLNDTKLNEIIDNSSNTIRYQGFGFLYLNNNPIFYKNNNFITYMFPHNYQCQFSDFEIAPKKVSAVINPSSNYIYLTNFLKWLNSVGGKLKIFSDDKDNISSVKKLFKNLSISHDSYTAMEYSHKSGLKIKNLNGTYNIKVDYIFSNNEELCDSNVTLVVIKGKTGIKKLINIPADGLLINCSIYEEVVMTLKQIKFPAAIVDDGSKFLNRINTLDYLIIRNNVQYDIIKIKQKDYVINFYLSILKILKPFQKNGTTVDESVLFEIVITEHQFDDDFELYNYLQFLRAIFKTTENRSLAAKVKEYYNRLALNKDFNLIFSGGIRSNLIISDCGFFDLINIGNTTIFSADMDTSLDQLIKLRSSTVFDKISVDRERLNNLLSLFNKNDDENIQKLMKSIDERKSVYKADINNEKHIEHFISITKTSNENINTVSSELSSNKPGNIIYISKTFFYKIRLTAINSLNFLKPLKKHVNGSSLKNTISHDDKKLPDSFGNKSKKLSNTDSNKIISLTDKTKLFFNQIIPAAFKKSLSAAKRNPITTVLITFVLLTVLSLLIIFFPTKDIVPKVKTITPEKDPVNITEIIEKPVTDSREGITELKIDNAPLITKYSIKVSNKDIYVFTNEIAELNGYSKIPYKEINLKNPDWIFPGNVFKLPSNGVIIVKEGDSIWAIAADILTKKHIEFYNLLEIILDNKKKNVPVNNDIEKLKALSFNDDHKQIISELENNGQ